MVDPDDAPKISIPVILLASKDEDPEAVKAYEANLKGDKYVETFGDQIHGYVPFLFTFSPLSSSPNGQIFLVVAKSKLITWEI